jgi:hypothetical protein
MTEKQIGFMLFFACGAVITLAFHVIMKEYRRACGWAAVTAAVIYFLILFLRSHDPMTGIALFLTWPLFYVFSLVTGLPFLIVRRIKEKKASNHASQAIGAAAPQPER